MNKYLKVVLLGLGLSSTVVLHAQPVINNPANANVAGANSLQYWSRQGNTNANGTNNVFGTQTNYNAQVWSMTNGFYRMMMNNGAGGNADGYIGMGNNLPANFAPVDRLHLYQSGGTTAMRFTNFATGLTATDGLQVGVLALGAAVIRDYDASRNILIGTNNGGVGVADRIKVCSFAENGFVAMGNVNAFGQPRSQLHIMQYGPNMQTPLLRGEIIRTDGENNITNAWRLYTGINSVVNSEKFSIQAPANSNNGELYTTSGDMLFFTESVNFGDLQRLRLTNGIGNQLGVPQQDATRVNISYGSVYGPITNPVALLNLGFDPPVGPNGGQRAWMDVGAFMCAGSDNVYLGLKNEDPNGNFGPNGNNDRMDAVLNWGDNTQNQNPFGPDNLRFIFTMVQNPATATGPASTQGLEAMRITPAAVNANTYMFTGIGGDPQTNLYGPAQNSINPTQTVEVNSYGLTNAAGGSSGLRFTNLNTTSPTIANPGQGVLAVDANGDVVYVPAPTGVLFGGACGNQNLMPSDWEIPTNGFNYVFTGQSVNGDNVGIGLPNANCAPIAKLEVLQQSTVNNSTGVFSRNLDNDGVALRASALGTASGTQTKVAGWFEASVGFGSQQVAIYVPQLGGVVNIGYPTPNSGQFALLNVNGSITSNGLIVQTSDASIKTNVNTIQNAGSIIDRLRPVSYNYTTASISDSSMVGLHFGLIAQEVDTVLSEVVHTDGNGLKSVSYIELMPYLIAAYQDEHRRNDSLAAALSALTNTVNGCCNNNSRTANNDPLTIRNIELNNNAVVLEQNIPNPFADQTTITYTIPADAGFAQIVFYDAQGKMIRLVDITEKGKGQLNVFAGDLSTGIYTYSLIVDGKVIDTKRMVKTN